MLLVLLYQKSLYQTVPNVTPAPKVLKMTKNHSSVPKMYQKQLGVLIGVVYQMVYQTLHVTKCTKCTKLTRDDV